MQLIGAGISSTAESDLTQFPGMQRYAESERFKAMAVYDRNGKKTALFGVTNKFPELSPPQMSALKKTGATILTSRLPDQSSSTFMAGYFIRRNKNQYYILGEINETDLARVITENLLPAMTDFLVLDSSQNILISSIKPVKNLAAIMTNLTSDGVSGNFSWKLKDKAYRAGFRKLFL